MRALEIDFARRAKPFSVAGVAVFVVGALALGQAIHVERDSADEIAAAEARLNRLTRVNPALASQSAGGESLREEIAQANEVLQQLTLPWQPLFQAVESSADKDVALLSIQPDAMKRVVRLAGEAKNFKALLGYISRLEASGYLGRVYLTSHEIKTQDPDKPVRFALVADWRDPDGKQGRPKT